MGSPRLWLIAVAVFFATALAALILLPSLGLGGDDGADLVAPIEGSADVGFARDMSIHHAQAVEMSFILRDKQPATDVDVLAYDIINTQSTQRGMMQGWLNVWGLPVTSTDAPMAWAGGHDSHTSDGDSGMPGLATDEQMDDLRTATGVEAEKLFLELMIAHHEGGVEMAVAAQELAGESVVLFLADTIVVGQTAEISVMQDMLSVRTG